jgi:hypothetical protein
VPAILRSLAGLGKSIAFTGDSMMFQTAVAFECEFLRDGYAIRQESEDKRETQNWRHGVYNVISWRVAVEGAEQDADVYHFAQYRYNRTSFRDFEEMLAKADVLVVNFGVHWLSREAADYRDAMRDLFDFLRPHVATHTIVWRETYAQHFDSEGGEFAASSERCVDVVYGEKERHMWRDVIVREVLEELDLPIAYLNETSSGSAEPGSVFWLPVHDYSRLHWKDVHKVHPATGMCEATHVCHAPRVWGGVWNMLARAII